MKPSMMYQKVVMDKAVFRIHSPFFTLAIYCLSYNVLFVSFFPYII